MAYELENIAILNTKGIYYRRVICDMSRNDAFNKLNNFNLMDTSSSILHQFDLEIPRGMFVEITSVLKGESMWKL